MSKIFFSYARGDDESFVRRLFDDLTTRGFYIWFDRVSMPSRGLTFHQEIRDAVADCDRLLLIVGPRAIASDYVRQEWQFAWYQAEKVVTPIMRIGDYPLPLDELALLHCEDFTEDNEYDVHLDNLARQLSEPLPPLGKLIAVPKLPVHFMARSERLRSVRDALRADLDGPNVIGGESARVGMHGMGGIGKSVLASAVSHDRLIRRAFPDGIVWISFGSSPNVADLQRRVHRDLGGDGAFETAHAGKHKLKDLLANKAVLLVLDNVWRRADADSFDVLGPRCRALVTTRDAGLLTSLGGTHHVVELLTDTEAHRLLANETGVPTDELPAEATDLVSECGRLPLAVGLCGALIRRRMSWQSVLEQLRQARIDRIADRHAVEPHHRSVWHAIHIGVEALAPDERERFLELAVFPSDEATPQAAAATLWAYTGQLDDWSSQELLSALCERSLIQTSQEAAETTDGTRRFWLHDLLFDYARQTKGNLRPLHGTLLLAYESCCTSGWPSGPNDGYFFEHLRDHLLAANRSNELGNLLLDLHWLEVKNKHQLTFDLTADYRAALAGIPKKDPQQNLIRLIDEALRRDLHFIARHAKDYPQGLFQCLWNTAWWYDSPVAAIHYDPPEGGVPSVGTPWKLGGPKLSGLLEDWRERRSTRTAWLRSLRPPRLPLDSWQQAILRGHEDTVTSVAYSPDGRWIISGSWDRTLRSWDSESGRTLHTFDGHLGAVNSVAFSPDGRQIASASNDGTVRVWDAELGTELTVLRGHTDSVNGVAYSPDGRKIASGSRDRTLRVWDSNSWSQLSILRGTPEDMIMGVAFSPNGKEIIGGCYYATVRVWDAETGKQLAELWGHDKPFWSVAYAPNGRKIAGASGSDAGPRDDTVYIWDVQSGKARQTLRGHEKIVESVAYSPDGRTLVSGSCDKTVRVWDADSGENVAVLRGHEDRVNVVAYSPDGRQIATGSGDNTVRVWNADKQNTLSDLWEPNGTICSVACSPNGQRVVSAAGSPDCRVREWDANSGRRLRVLRGRLDPKRSASLTYTSDGARVICRSGPRFLNGARDGFLHVWDAASSAHTVLRLRKGGVLCLAVSPDNKQVAFALDDRTFRIWDAEMKSELFVLKEHEDWPTCVAYSPDGRRIITGSVDGSVLLWDSTTGAFVKTLMDTEQQVCSVAYSPNSERVTAAFNDGTTRLLDVENAIELAVLGGSPQSAAASTAFSPDGRQIVSGSFDGTVQIWDAYSGESLSVLRGHEDQVLSVAFSPSGGRIASVSSDESVRIWHVDSQAQHSILRGHEGVVRSVAFSPDNRHIVSGSFDKTIRVWDAHTGAQLIAMNGDDLGAVICVAFSCDGQRIISGSSDGTVRVWSAESGKELSRLLQPEPELRAEFSADGERILIREFDGTAAQLWDVDSGYREKTEDEKAREAESPATVKVYVAGIEGSETVIRLAQSGEPIAWLPIKMENITAHPDGLSWSGSLANHLCLFHLQSTEAPSIARR